MRQPLAMADNRSKPTPPAATAPTQKPPTSDAPSPAAAVTPAGGDAVAHGSATPGAVTPAGPSQLEDTPETRTSPEPSFEVQFSTQPGEVRQRARALYDGYVKNSRGLAWDGRKCPSWEALGDGVRSHWCAVAIMGIGFEGQAVAYSGRQLVGENARLTSQLEAAQQISGEVSETRVTAAMRERTKMLDADCEKLRARIAQLEKQLREQTAAAAK